MADLLTPMLPVGVTDASELLLYSETDFYGLEDPPAAPTNDFRGFNEALAWTRRVSAGMSAEHFLNGIHDTLKIPRALLFCNYSALLGYTVGARSYMQTDVGVIYEGTAAATLTYIATGEVKVSLPGDLPSTDYTIVDMSLPIPSGNVSLDFFGETSRVLVWCATITDPATFTVKRREAADFSALPALTDGDFVIAVYG